MGLIQRFALIYAFCGGLLIIFCCYCIISVKKFINKRYEQETALMDTVFFQEHVVFARHVPNFISASLYATHLMFIVWGWELFRKNKVFRDIEKPEKVTQHFTQNEIFRVKRLILIYFVALIYLIGFYAFKFIFPLEFGR